jgi:hypothetical protein
MYDSLLRQTNISSIISDLSQAQIIAVSVYIYLYLSDENNKNK